MDQYISGHARQIRQHLIRLRITISITWHLQAREKLETETEGFTETLWHGVEIFAQGLGLVYYRKTISEQFILEYRLAEILEYPTFQTQYLIQSTHQDNAQ